MKTTLYYMHALTALHAGTGQGVGIIDLPIAREKSTGLPIIPGSGIKGVLREELRPEENDSEKQLQWTTLFGPKSDDAEQGGYNSFAGALTIQDAQILCFPVRSIYGTFAWVTCPFILNRFCRDSQATDLDILTKVGLAPTDDELSITSDSKLSSSDKVKVFLEDLDLTVVENNTAMDKIADALKQQIFPNDDTWQQLFVERFTIVSDEVFSFLAETATEVRARIRLQEGTRTVDEGALWYEENLPIETLLWGITGFDRSRQKGQAQKAEDLVEAFETELLKAGEVRLQVGGKATVGRGHVRWLLASGGRKHANQITT